MMYETYTNQQLPAPYIGSGMNRLSTGTDIISKNFPAAHVTAPVQVHVSQTPYDTMVCLGDRVYTELNSVVLVDNDNKWKYVEDLYTLTGGEWKSATFYGVQVANYWQDSRNLELV